MSYAAADGSCATAELGGIPPGGYIIINGARDRARAAEGSGSKPPAARWQDELVERAPLGGQPWKRLRLD